MLCVCVDVGVCAWWVGGKNVYSFLDSFSVDNDHASAADALHEFWLELFKGKALS